MDIDTVVSLGKSVTDVVASLAPIPWLKPAVSILTEIIRLCRNVGTNRETARYLRDRCIMLLVALRDSGNSSPKITDALDAVTETLLLIQEEMNDLAKLGRIKSWLKQGDIAKNCQRCHVAITDCLMRFTLVSHLEIHNWQFEFNKGRENDHREVITKLEDLENSRTTTQDALTCSEPELAQCIDILRKLLSKMQNNLPNAGDDLRADLHQLLSKCHELLPDPKFQRGELEFSMNRRVAIVGGMDVYEGIYLGREKVTIKMVSRHDSKPNPKGTRRLMREADIWKKVYSVDKGQHLVAIYGFFEPDNSGPYLVSPLQENGTAIDYVKKNENVDYRQLVRGIAEGIRVLHTMEPPIVHGDIQGANIFMSSEHKPLIANFGVSRLVEDIAGAPYTQSNALPNTFRWHAPEICREGGGLSLGSDVYAFSMTILELMTHKQPFAEHKHATMVVVNSARGERPRRPSEPTVVNRGLDDMLWTLISKGWDMDRYQRPSIQEMLSVL